MKKNYNPWLPFAVIGPIVIVVGSIGGFLRVREGMTQRSFTRAAEAGDVPSMERALASGAKVNKPVKDRPAIFWAAQGDQPKAIAFLAKRGADLNYRDPKGAMPLTMAVNLRKVKSVRALLAAGANPNVTNSRGSTPLQIAASRGDVELVRLLVKAKASPAMGASGQTPIDLARDKPDVMRELRRAGR